MSGKYTGQYADPLSGFDYYNARYYDPVCGVFLSADPVEGNMQGMNPYAYVDGNPETYTDPTGNMYAPPGGGGGGGNGGGGTPPPSPPGNGGGWVGGFVHAAVTVVKSAADMTLGISSMVNDVQTITSGNASWQAKLWAGADLLLNVGMDVMLVTGIGEEARGVYEAGKIGLSLLMHGGEDMALHEGEDLLTHAGEEEATHLAESGACSFIAATRVMTATGELAIGTLHVGQKVLAYNPKTHKMELQPILHVWIHTDNDLVDLTLTTATHAPHSTTVTKTSETIHTNQKHPFFTEEKGFVPVGQLKLGMHVLRADGRSGVITGWKIVPGVKVMYNLEVAQDHTFTVGAGEWVVHNCGTSGSGDPTQRLAQTRQELGMVARSTSPDDRQTLAILESDGKEYWGINGSKPISFSVNAISKTHAEIDTLDQLARDRAMSGMTGGTGEMWVDRPPCPACGLYGGIRSGVRAVGLDQLKLWYPGGSMSIFP